MSSVEQRTRRVRLLDLEIVALEWGAEGDHLVVAAHGFPDHAPTWRLLGEELATRGFRVVAPYLRGYAPSGTGKGPYHSVSIARDLVELCSSLRSGDEPVSLVGHDWGAAAAYPAAAAMGSELHRLVTLAVPSGPRFMESLVSDPNQQRRSWYMFFFQMSFAEQAVAHDDFAFLERLWRDWSPGYDPGEEEMEELKATFRCDGVLTAALQYYRDTFAPPALDDELSRFATRTREKVRAPCLYLHGEDDGCIGPEISEGMGDAFVGGLERRIVPGAGHFLHLERPRLIHGAIAEFLDG